MGRYVSYNADGTLGTGRYRERPKYKTTGPEDRRRSRAARDRERENIKKKPRRADNRLTSIARIEHEQSARFGQQEPKNLYVGHDNDWAPTPASRFADSHRSQPHIDVPAPWATLIFAVSEVSKTHAVPILSSHQATAKNKSGGDQELKPDLFIDIVLGAADLKLDNNGAALSGSDLRAATDDLARACARRDLESAKRWARLLLLQGRTNRSDLRAFMRRALAPLEKP